MGLAALGAGLGSIVVSIGGGHLIQAFGWRRTLQIIGAVGTVLLFVAILLVEKRPAPRKPGGFVAVSRKLSKIRNYRFFVASFAFWQTGFMVPYTFLPYYASSLGFDPTFAAFTLAMIGIGSSVGRVVFGPVADYFKLRLFTFKAAVLLTAVCMWVWPVCTTQPSILAFTFLYVCLPFNT